MPHENDYHKVLDYIKDHPEAVISTVDNDHTPHGAVVYIYTDNLKRLYFLTKTKTKKFTNLKDHSPVSLTFFDKTDNSTLQINGKSYIETDPHVVSATMQKLMQEQVHESRWIPPIARIEAGDFVLVSIIPQKMRLAEYGAETALGDDVFTDIKL
jgi:general stress protein 26